MNIIITLSACMACAIVHVQAQFIVREMHTSSLNVTGLQTLSPPLRILAVTDREVPLLSTDGGTTFQCALSAEEQFMLDGRAFIACDGQGRGIITGGNSTRTQFLSDDGGETWQRREFPTLAPRGDASLYTDGNILLDSYVSADAGNSWRKFVLPDSVPWSDHAGWPRGYSYGRGTLVRPTGVDLWYCIDHSTGLFAERPDIPADASYACELENGAKIVGIGRQNRPRVMVCPPGEECYSIDSVGPGVSLRDYQIREIRHYNDHILVIFNSEPFVVVLGPSGHRILDASRYVPGAKSLSSATCNSEGVSFRLSGYRVFVPHDERPATVVRVGVSTSDLPMLVGRTLLSAVYREGLVAVDFSDGSVRRVGTVTNRDRGVGEFVGFRDVYPTQQKPYAITDERHVIRIDTLNASPFEWRFGIRNRFAPSLVDAFELQDRARRRHEARFGGSNFWLVSPDVTASGGPDGIRIERHSTDSTGVVRRADTITMMTSINNGATVIAGHRALWSSQDTGITWTELPIPDIGSVVSAYTEIENKQLVGFRGFENTLNEGEITPTAGGLYMSTNGGMWERVNAVLGNHIYSVSVDADNSIWVVSTIARMEYTADVSATDTAITQIDVTQGDIDVHRSTDAGVTWNRIHAESSESSFTPITGAVSQGPSGHVIAMPSRLLFLPKGAGAFTSIDVLPLGVGLFSARMDARGRAWVATSDGVYVVDVGLTSSVQRSTEPTLGDIRVLPHPVPAGGSALVQCPTCPSEDFDVVDVIGSVVARVTGGILSAQYLASGVYFVRNTNGRAVCVLVL